MDWMNTIKAIAPTVASALVSPLAGAAVSAIGNILGASDATQDTIKQIITNGQLTAEQVWKLRELELKYQAEERERGFRYVELAFKDRDSARQASVQGGTLKWLFWLSLLLLLVTIGSEVVVLFFGYPKTLPEIIVGRVLGLLDSVALLVLSFWYGTTSGSQQKNELLAQAQPVK